MPQHFIIPSFRTVQHAHTDKTIAPLFNIIENLSWISSSIEVQNTIFFI